MFRSAIVLSLLCCLLSADGAPQGKALEINSKNVNAHKALYDRRPTKYQKSQTKYSDMISEEIPKPRGALPVDRNFPVMCTPPPDPSFHTRPLPPSVDYREQCMSPVRDQRGDGGCVNTCWSFSVTGALEYYYCNRTGQAVEFSKKYLVDCVGGNSGCNDGYIDEAMKWLINNKRIPSEASYPYNTINGLCHQVQDVYDLSSLNGCISGSGDDHLTRALAFMGPASILIDADIPAFVDFKTTDEDSVFEDKVCLAQRPINHAVLAVGYGTTKSGTDYYIIKNSWGPNWGLNGYAKIRRGENYCNTTSFVLNPDFK